MTPVGRLGDGIFFTNVSADVSGGVLFEGSELYFSQAPGAKDAIARSTATRPVFSFSGDPVLTGLIIEESKVIMGSSGGTTVFSDSIVAKFMRRCFSEPFKEVLQVSRIKAVSSRDSIIAVRECDKCILLI